MATTAWIAKWKRPPKFKVRAYNRCLDCARASAIYRDFGLCRLCFRKRAHNGEIPGVRKASW